MLIEFSFDCSACQSKLVRNLFVKRKERIQQIDVAWVEWWNLSVDNKDLERLSCCHGYETFDKYFPHSHTCTHRKRDIYERQNHYILGWLPNFKWFDRIFFQLIYYYDGFCCFCCCLFIRLRKIFLIFIGGACFLHDQTQLSTKHGNHRNSKVLKCFSPLLLQPVLTIAEWDEMPFCPFINFAR